MVEQDLARQIAAGEVSSDHETVTGQSIAAAVIIVYYDWRLNGDNSVDPLIATGKVIKDKPSSGREKDQVDIFLETRKKREPPLATMIGAIGEFCDDRTIQEVGKHLFFVDGAAGQIFVNGNRGDLFVLVYDGSRDLDFKPVDESESAFNRWMRVSEFLGSDNVRPIARQSIEQARSEGLFRSALDNFHDLRKRATVFPEGFSIDRFQQLREMRQDVEYNLGLPAPKYEIAH
jgi:hypothetical protein